MHFSVSLYHSSKWKETEMFSRFFTGVFRGIHYMNGDGSYTYSFIKFEGKTILSQVSIRDSAENQEHYAGKSR